MSFFSVKKLRLMMKEIDDYGDLMIMEI